MYTKLLAGKIRAGQMVPFIGTGLSMACGLPNWRLLVERIAEASLAFDAPAAFASSSQHYLATLRMCFSDDMALVSFVRARLARKDPAAFSEVLYSALYSTPIAPGSLLVPQPNDIHRYLVTIFNRQPRRIWTVNYDDLLEEAAMAVGVRVRTLHPRDYTAGNGLHIAHLHGFLPASGREPRGFPGIQHAVSDLTLAEDDFHAVAADQTGWTSREFYRLVQDHAVLMLGLSLQDPNLRRVLAMSRHAVNPTPDRHFALLTPLGPQDITPQSDTALSLYQQADLARHANELREWYWKDRDLTVVHVPDYSYITPFLARLHYETYGRHSGQLWEDAARAYERVRPQVPAAQQVVRAVLLGAIGRLERDFRISDPDEVLELGIFLLTPKHQLELVFRGNKRKAKKPGRTFSAGPDTPTGLAGRVYASCQGVRVHTTDKLHNYHVPSSPKRETDYSGIVATPVIDWRSKGLPLGVAYLTTSTADGKVFQLLDQPSGGLYKQQADKPAIVPIDVTLSDLFRYLSDVALAVLSLFDH
jgi:hypothetical protein